MQIAILLFDGFAAIDAVAFHDAFAAIPGADTVFVAVRPGPWRNETGQLELTAVAALHEVPHPHVVVVPGGAGASVAGESRVVRRWLADAVSRGAWAVLVSDGVLVAAGAGLDTGPGGGVDNRVAVASGAKDAPRLTALLQLHLTQRKGHTND